MAASLARSALGLVGSALGRATRLLARSTQPSRTLQPLQTRALQTRPLQNISNVAAPLFTPYRILPPSFAQSGNFFLAPPSPSCVQHRGYKVRVSLKRRCSGCYFVRRRGRLYMECTKKPRHKTMQVMSKRKTWKEDYSKGNIVKALHWKWEKDNYYKIGQTRFVHHDWLKGKIGVTV